MINSIVLATTFVYKLKMQIIPRLYRLLTKNQLAMIGDLSFSKHVQRSLLLRTIRMLGRKLLGCAVLSPHSFFYRTWSFVMMLALYVTILLVPVKICFEVQINPIYFHCVVVLLVIDFLIQLNTGKYTEGIITYDRKVILRIYLSRKLTPLIAVATIRLRGEEPASEALPLGEGLPLRLSLGPSPCGE